MKSLKYHKKAVGLTIDEAINKLRSRMPVEEGGVSFYLSSEIVNSNHRNQGLMGVSNSAYKYSSTSAYASAYAHQTNYDEQQQPVPSPRESAYDQTAFVGAMPSSPGASPRSSFEYAEATPSPAHEPAWRSSLPRNTALPQTKTML